MKKINTLTVLLIFSALLGNILPVKHAEAFSLAPSASFFDATKDVLAEGSKALSASIWSAVRDFFFGTPEATSETVSSPVPVHLAPSAPVASPLPVKPQSVPQQISTERPVYITASIPENIEARIRALENRPASSASGITREEVIDIVGGSVSQTAASIGSSLSTSISSHTSFSNITISGSNGSSTFSNGINLTTGCFSVAGTCIGAGGGGSGTVNTGTTGQFPYYAANGTELTATSSLFMAANGYVGIGTTSPSGILTVSGEDILFQGSSTIPTSAIVKIDGGSYSYGGSNRPILQIEGSSGYDHTLISGQSSSATEVFRVEANGDTKIGGSMVNGTPNTTILATGGATFNANSSAVDLIIRGDTDGALFIAKGSTDRIGIGTSTPYAKLSVVGEVVASHFTGTTTATSTFMGKVGIGTTTPWGFVSINPSATLGSQPSFVIGSSSATNFIVTNKGNIGIGTTSPYAKLSVVSTLDQPVLVLRPPFAQTANIMEIYQSAATRNSVIAFDSENGGLRWGIGTTSPVSTFAIQGISAGALSNAPDALTVIGGEGFVEETSGTDGGGVTFTTGRGADGLDGSGGSAGDITFTGGLGGTGTDGTHGAGGDFTFTAGNGGGATGRGGFVRIQTGLGGSGSYENLYLNIPGGKVAIGSSSPWALLSVSPLSNLGTAPFFAIGSSTGTHFLVNNVGKTAIGTTTASHRLTVQGGVCVTAGAACTAEVSGTIVADGVITQNAFDIAEIYPTTDSSIEAGDIVAIDPQNDLGILKATKTSSIIGIISTKPGFTLGDSTKGKPVALAGRVPVKFSTENGSVTRGDNLTISSTPGIAAKANSGDPVIGTALEQKTTDGFVTVFIRAGYQNIASLSPEVEVTDRSSVFDTISASVARFTEIIADKITATLGIFKKIQVEDGIEMKDKKTGQIYCVTVEDGLTKTTAGECSATSQGNPSSEDDSIDEDTGDVPEETATTTPSTDTTITEVNNSTAAEAEITSSEVTISDSAVPVSENE